MAEKMLTTAEAASLVGQSQSNMTNIRKRGHLPGAKQADGNTWLYPESEVLAYAEKVRGNGGRLSQGTGNRIEGLEPVSLAQVYSAKITYAVEKILREYEQALRKKTADEILGRG